MLNNSNPTGDPATAPRCGAKARTRGGRPCQAPAIRGKTRCRMHGGLSTGPRTPEGLAKSRRARWTHGQYAQDTIAARRAALERAQWEAEATRQARLIIAQMFKGRRWRR